MSGEKPNAYRQKPIARFFFKSNRGIAAILLLATFVLAASIWSSEWAHEKVRDGFHLGFFPLLSLGAMALSLVVMLFDAKARETTSSIEILHPVHAVIALGVLAYVGTIFLSIPIIGFIPSFFVLIAGGALILGLKPYWLALAVGLTTAFALRFLLMALDVPVPDGVFSIMFGS